jgi:hypothetical protein
MRVLTVHELDLVAGGSGGNDAVDPITVIGRRNDNWSPPSALDYAHPITPGGPFGSGASIHFSATDPGIVEVDEITVTAKPNPHHAPLFQYTPFGPLEAGPDCKTTNWIDGLIPPDNAIYLVPENVSDKYIVDAINHLRSIEGPIDKISAFNSMFTNPSDPYFIDLKDWGHKSGPTGSASGGTVTYFSDALGKDYTGSVFEAFGNYLYGFVGMVGGIEPDVLKYAASITQTGAPAWDKLKGIADQPEDRSHVSMGIDDGMKWISKNYTVFEIIIGHC